jgi:hypothetical protein
MDPEGSLQCLQQSSIGSHAESIVSSPYTLTFSNFKINYNIYLPSKTRSCTWLLCIGFPARLVNKNRPRRETLMFAKLKQVSTEIIV